MYILAGSVNPHVVERLAKRYGVPVHPGQT